MLIRAIIDHFTRFAALVALPDKKEQTIAKALVEWVFSIFGPPETLHSYQGPEFENKVVKQLQDVFGYKKKKNDALSSARQPGVGAYVFDPTCHAFDV